MNCFNVAYCHICDVYYSTKHSEQLNVVSTLKTVGSNHYYDAYFEDETL